MKSIALLILAINAVSVVFSKAKKYDKMLEIYDIFLKELHGEFQTAYSYEYSSYFIELKNTRFLVPIPTTEPKQCKKGLCINDLTLTLICTLSVSHTDSIYGKITLGTYEDFIIQFNLSSLIISVSQYDDYTLYANSPEVNEFYIDSYFDIITSLHFKEFQKDETKAFKNSLQEMTIKRLNDGFFRKYNFLYVDFQNILNETKSALEREKEFKYECGGGSGLNKLLISSFDIPEPEFSSGSSYLIVEDFSVTFEVGYYTSEKKQIYQKLNMTVRLSQVPRSPDASVNFENIMWSEPTYNGQCLFEAFEEHFITNRNEYYKNN